MLRESDRCNRARQWVSLKLDGELSDFERSLLAAHLAGCEDCRAFRADADSLTAELRSAPLERPHHPIVLPHRRRRAPIALRVASAAAAVVALAGIAASTLAPGNARRVSAPRGVFFGANVDGLNEFRLERTLTERGQLSGRPQASHLRRSGDDL